MNEGLQAAALAQALRDSHSAKEFTWRQGDCGVDQHAAGGVGGSVCVGAALGDIARAWLGPVGGEGPAALQGKTLIRPLALACVLAGSDLQCRHKASMTQCFCPSIDTFHLTNIWYRIVKTVVLASKAFLSSATFPA